MAHRLVSSDPSGGVLFCLLGGNALFLATGESARKKILAVLSYFNNVKNYMYDRHPDLIQVCERNMGKVADVVDKYCQARPGAAPVKQALPYTKKDLRLMNSVLLESAASEIDFTDAPLLVLMWYVFGRNRDMVSCRKAIFVCILEELGCIKTNVDQGIALFVDKTTI